MDRKGKILIPGINEAVAPVTEDELGLYDKIDFDLEEYARDVGAETLLHSCKVRAPPGPPAARSVRSQGLPPCPGQGTPEGGSQRCRQTSVQMRVPRSPRMVPTLESSTLPGLELELGGF